MGAGVSLAAITVYVNILHNREINMAGSRKGLLRGAKYGNWGFILAAVIGAGVSIYAVADSEMQVSSFTGPSTKTETVCAEDLDQLIMEVAAFNPFSPEEKVSAPQEIVAAPELEMEETLAATRVPDPTLLSEEIGLEPSRTPTPSRTPSRLAANARGQNTPPRGNHPGGNTNPNKNTNPWGKGGQYSWVLPTAIIAGGATGITLGTVAVVRNNQGVSSKNPPLTN
jgi:hypothetical protein